MPPRPPTKLIKNMPSNKSRISHQPYHIVPYRFFLFAIKIISGPKILPKKYRDFLVKNLKCVNRIALKILFTNYCLI